MDLFDNHIHISLLALCSSVWWLCCTYLVEGNDPAVEGTFIWTSDNSALGFVNWQPREPDNNKGVDDCVSICSDERWSDSNCDDSFSYICKTPVL